MCGGSFIIISIIIIICYYLLLFVIICYYFSVLFFYIDALKESFFECIDSAEWELRIDLRELDVPTRMILPDL
jgi:hypothetical protein